MLKCAHLCIFRLVCACTGQICCLMVAHNSNCIVFSNTIQFAICALCLHGIHTVFCILYFSHPYFGGNRDSRHYHSCVQKRTMCTVTFLCKIERPLFCIVYRNATLMCICVDTATYFLSSTHPFQVLLDDRAADLQLCFLNINLS